MIKAKLFKLPLPYYIMDRARQNKISATDFIILTLLRQIDEPNRNGVFISAKVNQEYSYICKKIKRLKLKGYIKEIKRGNKRILNLTEEGLKQQDSWKEILYGGSSK